MKRMSGIVDMHTHILPGLDDGAKNIEYSEKLLDMAYEQGVRYIIATPHYMKSEYQYKAEELLEKFEQVRQLAANKYPDLSIFLGQEIFYSISVVENLQSGEIQTLNGTRYVLVEFSTHVSYKEMYSAMKRLLLARYIPILAHMERFECLYKKMDRIEELRRIGVLFQMNFESLTGGFFDSRAKECRKLILEAQIDFLGTDMHHPQYRPPKIEEALSWIDKKVPKDIRDKILYKNAIELFKLQ